MKYLFLLLFLLPLPALCQVRIADMKSEDGLGYYNNALYTGVATDSFPNGKVKLLITYKDGLPDGAFKTWHSDGTPEAEGTTRSGKKEGVWKLYYTNGRLKKTAVYNNDLQNGEETFWNEDGKKQKSGSYNAGKLNGYYVWYNEQGEKESDGYFIMGKEDSIWRGWWGSGKLKMEGHFRNGNKNGQWTWYDEQGHATQTKQYRDGLPMSNANDIDNYLEKTEYYLAQRDYKECIKNITSAEATIADRTEQNKLYMGLLVYHAKCQYLFSHFLDAEHALLTGIGLTPAQAAVIEATYKDTTGAGVLQLIDTLKGADTTQFTLGHHIALALCYNLLHDSLQLQHEQQLMMEKGDMQDWIINTSLELYKLTAARQVNYFSLQAIDSTIKKDGTSTELELQRALYLLRNEQFTAAEKMTDGILKKDANNVDALLLKADIAMATGAVVTMHEYEQKVKAIDPTAALPAED